MGRSHSIKIRYETFSDPIIVRNSNFGVLASGLKAWHQKINKLYYTEYVNMNDLLLTAKSLGCTRHLEQGLLCQIQMTPKANPSFNAPWNEVLKSPMVTKCTGMRNIRPHTEAVGKHLQLGTQPCTNSSFNLSSKPMTGTVGDPVINCMISESSISGTPEKKIVLYFTYREYM